MAKLAHWLLTLDLALWLGASTYFSLFAAPALFAGLDVDTAGRAVGLLFPTFFRLCAVLAPLGWLLAAWAYRAAPGLAPVRRARVVSHVLFAVGSVIAWVNAFVLLPMIQGIEQRMGPVSHASPAMLRQFGMVHGISMLLDLAMILCAALAALCIVWRDARREMAR
ncbi:MAG: DUF4149 domain-containing protein [Thermoflavifilum sp.]|nr:DUF4149 domain-containing protein [Thermoflavifilum sp.]MCL6514443.1 DUF4149 domain-containing protein [Alicyclobacillus sp.]